MDAVGCTIDVGYPGCEATTDWPKDSNLRQSKTIKLKCQSKNAAEIHE